MNTFAMGRNAICKAGEEILAYWLRLKDDRFGGWYGQVNGEEEICQDADKGLVIQARLLWTLSAAYRVFGNERYLLEASNTYDYLQTVFLDKEFGGYLWIVSPEGSPKDLRKQAYGQAFCLYALSEYYSVCKKENVLADAQKVFRLLQDRFYDAVYGGYAEVLDRSMSGKLESVKMLEDDVDAAKTMNTQLHVMEALTSYYNVSHEREAGEALRRVVELYMDKVMDWQSGHLKMFFDEQWNSLSARITYGHDIESAWLVGEAVEALGDAEIAARAKQMTMKLAESTLREGVGADGGLSYETLPGKWTDDDRCWWVQAECAVGMMYAHAVSGEERYREAGLKSWEFIHTYVMDHQHGEWYRRVRLGGEPKRELNKVDLWKCPYHNVRCCMELLKYL